MTAQLDLQQAAEVVNARQADAARAADGSLLIEAEHPGGGG